MDVPRTDALQDQIELSERAEKAVLRQCLENGVLPGTHEADQINGANILLFPRFRSAVRQHAFGQNVSDRVMGAILKKVADRCDNNGKLFVGKDGQGHPRYVRTQQYIFPALDEARRSFDPHAKWPNSPLDWEFERGRDDDMEPCNDDDPF